MNIVSGDLLDIKEGIIVHQVNNRHVMGAGIALQIRKKYYQHYADYMKAPMVMGSIIATKIDKLTIVGIVAQDGFGRDKRYTDYVQFTECLRELSDYAKDEKVYFPFGIGCNNGGGSWVVISDIIDTFFPDCTIVKLI